MNATRVNQEGFWQRWVFLIFFPLKYPINMKDGWKLFAIQERGGGGFQIYNSNDIADIINKRHENLWLQRDGGVFAIMRVWMF